MIKFGDSYVNRAVVPSIKVNVLLTFMSIELTLSWQRSQSYRKQSIHMQSKSMDWFLYDSDFRHERVKLFDQVTILMILSIF